MRKLLVIISIASIATSTAYSVGARAQSADSQNSSVQKLKAASPAKRSQVTKSGQQFKQATSPAQRSAVGQKRVLPATKSAPFKKQFVQSRPNKLNIQGGRSVPTKLNYSTVGSRASGIVPVSATAQSTAPSYYSTSQPMTSPSPMLKNYAYAPTTTTGTAPMTRTRVETNKTTVESTNPWSFSYTSYNAYQLSGLENGSSNPDDYEILATDRAYLGYKLSDDISFGILGEFNHSWFGNPNRAQSGQAIIAGVPQFQQPGSAYFGDTALILSDAKLAKLRGGVTMDGYVRYYIPTSEASQMSGTYGYTRTSLGFTKSVGIVDFHVSEQLRYYFQQYQTSAALKAANGMPVQNYNYRVFSLLDVGVNITKKLTFALETGFENREYYADDNVATQRPVVEDFQYILNPEMSYSFNKTLGLSLGVWDETSLLGRTIAYSPFDALQNGVEAYMQLKISL